jgi:hypothetical protein
VSGGRAIRDRDVLMVLGAIVAVVLGASLVALLVPAVRSTFERIPIVVVLLIAVTTVVLGRALMRRR